MPSTVEELRARVSSLGARERDVLNLIVDGVSNDAMSKRLGISVKTIETHRARINRKLGVSSPIQLLRLCFLAGLLLDIDSHSVRIDDTLLTPVEDRRVTLLKERAAKRKRRAA